MSDFDLEFELSGKLTRWFCTVQSMLSAAGAAAFPGSLPAFATSVVILTCMLAARESVAFIADTARAKLVFDWAWCTSMVLWLPFGVALRLGVFAMSVPSTTYAFGGTMWMLFALFQRVIGISTRSRLLSLAMVAITFFLQPGMSELGQPAEGLVVASATLVGELLGNTYLSHVSLLQRRTSTDAPAAWRQPPETLEPSLRELIAQLDGVPQFDARGWETSHILGRGHYGVAVLLRSRAAAASTCVSKKVRVEGMADADLAMLANEMKVAGALHHPNLIAFRGYYLHLPEGLVCLIFEFAPGGTLAQRIEQRREAKAALPTADVARWLAQLADALIYMHARRVVHRDVKIQNIFLDARGRAKLGDFGIARIMSTASGSRTQTYGHTICGTPSNMCPEILKGAGCGPPGDAWALGIVLYQLLTTSAEGPFRLPRGAAVVALIATISTYDGTLEAHAAQQLDTCPHPPALCALAAGSGLLHPDPARRPPLEAVHEQAAALAAPEDAHEQ